MNVRNITTAAASLVLIMALSTGCRHHREVVYVNGTPPPTTTTVVYENTPPVNNTVVYTNNQQQVMPPVVSIAYPVANFASPGNYITVRGNIQNILLAHQINISQNGYPVRYFSYDPFNGNFHFQTFLQQGTNNIIITANNAYGTGSQGVTVFFNPTYMSNGAGYANGGYPNNSINPNANVAPNGGNYSNNSNANVAQNGGNYPNNSINPNANIAPNGGGGYPNNSINPNANGGINPINNNTGRPFIQYTNPFSSPQVVAASSYNVSASVINITNPNQITVSVNGSTLSSFNFNPSTHSLSFTAANLLTGFNSIHISATNQAGTDTKSTVIDYKPAAGASPRIEIFNPATSPFLSLQQNFIVSGYVYNVTSSSEISASFNGSPISFNYNQSTQEIEVPLNLTGSTNQLIIKATNNGVTDVKQVSLSLVSKNCSPSNNNTTNIQTGGVIQPNGNNNNNVNNTPHTGQQNPNLQTNGGVTYIDQQMNGNNNTPHVGQQNPNIQTPGGVTYIDQNNSNNNPHVAQQSQNIQPKGVTYIDQQMNGSNNTPHTGQQNPNLQAGGVTYIDQHLNNNATSGGTGAMGQTGIRHQPEITRTSPGSSPYTTMSGVISVGANVNYVTNASEVSVTYNGSSVSFSYNPQISEALNFTSPLSPGMNTFVIKATNSYGSAIQDISVNYVPTNTSGNANGNPNMHFESGINNASNTPRGFNVNNNNQAPQRPTEPIKVNTAKPIQQSNGKEAIKPR